MQYSGHNRSQTNRTCLEKLLSRMGDILSTISDGFFALDSDFTVTYSNQAAEQMLGSSASVV